jgi:hypothetical protein
VPENFKGKYKVMVEADLGPFETKQEDIWYSIE